MENEKDIKRQKIISEFLDKYPFMKYKMNRRNIAYYKSLSDEEFDKKWGRELRMAEGIRKCQIEDLWDGGVKFLKEHFNVTVDINTLSDEEFEDLQDRVFSFEVNEAAKVDTLDGLVTWENGRRASISEIGTIAMRVRSYMEYQYKIGGRRYKTT